MKANYCNNGWLGGVVYSIVDRGNYLAKCTVSIMIVIVAFGHGITG